ncbi:hypothetical protein HO173_005331 [Letharia columbiana]|uniref:MYND-type zinc finger protein samB n=1 Tax=Letharia columbiana TaxID=112416 RepID=A0A8H6FXH1_9LECA|nr:uncharacterized protein HO173_005331 [Letharia columbiana]KAF6236550.1 hypothetical protein HO173_005331 [Letharia columbiana]
MATLPKHIYTQITPDAGTGLFASEAIPPGVEILRIERPLVSVLDSPHLKDTCSECSLWLPQNDDDRDPKCKRLKACQACKVTKYCCKECQTQSWKKHHKYECKIFAKLYPNVLPNTVRIVMQLLLRLNAKSLPDREWQAFLDLQSHVDEIRSSQIKNEDGLTTWHAIELMSQAASSYSGSQEPISFIQTLTARILINSHTLTTPNLDPLGLCLSPHSALLNHSCTPNTAIVFSGSTLTLRSLAAISAKSELSISYIDTTNPTSARQSELRSRYFFNCSCSPCSAGITNGLPDPRPDHNFDAVQARAVGLQAEASTLPQDRAAALLKSALGFLGHYPPHRQPSPSILHTAFLNAIATQSWAIALSYALKAYFLIDPLHYRSSWHPVRVVRKWVLLRLVTQIAGIVSEGDGSIKGLEKFGINWQIVAVGLFHEISDGAPHSHGSNSPFTAEVKAFGEGAGMGRGKCEKGLLEEEWAKLRKVADG